MKKNLDNKIWLFLIADIPTHCTNYTSLPKFFIINLVIFIYKLTNLEHLFYGSNKHGGMKYKLIYSIFFLDFLIVGYFCEI